MYRKPRFLKVLHAIREQMSREVDYDVDLFVEMVRAGEQVAAVEPSNIRTYRKSGKLDDSVAAAPGEVVAQSKGRRRAAR